MDAATELNGTPDPRPEKVAANPNLFKKIRYGVLITYGVLILLGLLTWWVQIIPGLNIGLPLILVPFIHFAFSWRIINQDEWGAFFFWERPLVTGEPGPHFLPRGLVQMRTAPRKRKQFQAPGEPEQVFRGDDKVPLPDGMVRPIRITTRAPKEGETGHLDVQMTASWSFYVQYQILDLFRFFSIVVSFENAEKLMRDTGEAVLNEFASKHTMNGMIENLPEINKVLDNRIRDLVNSWGMEVYEARALAPDLSHSLSEELRNIASTRAIAEQTRERAAAERVRLEEEGLGAAAALAARLEAEAEGREQFLTAEAGGLEAKMNRLGVSGADVLAAEVASDALASADSIIVGADGIRDLAGMAVAAKHVLGGGSKPSTTKKSETTKKG